MPTCANCDHPHIFFSEYFLYTNARTLIKFVAQTGNDTSKIDDDFSTVVPAIYTPAF